MTIHRERERSSYGRTARGGGAHRRAVRQRAVRVRAELEVHIRQRERVPADEGSIWVLDVCGCVSECVSV